MYFVLNPQNEKFLRFEVDGQCYYMSGLTDEETVNVYQYLLETCNDSALEKK